MQGIQLESMVFEIIMVAVAAGTGLILHRVWKIPTIEAKLDNVSNETDKNREKIHKLTNSIYSHETRISILEKAKEETNKSKTASSGPSR